LAQSLVIAVTRLQEIGLWHLGWGLTKFFAGACLMTFVTCLSDHSHRLFTEPAPNYYLAEVLG